MDEEDTGMETPCVVIVVTVVTVMVRRVAVVVVDVSTIVGLALM